MSGGISCQLLVVVVRRLLGPGCIGEEVSERLFGFPWNVLIFKRRDVFVSSWRQSFALRLLRGFRQKCAGVWMVDVAPRAPPAERNSSLGTRLTDAVWKATEVYVDDRQPFNKSTRV